MSPSLADRLRLDDLRALRSPLAAARVKYVVLHRDLLYLARWAQSPAEVKETHDWYASVFPLVQADATASVFGVY